MGAKVVLNPLKGDTIYVKIGDKTVATNARIDINKMDIVRKATGKPALIIPRSLLSIYRSISGEEIEVEKGDNDSDLYVVLERKAYPFEGVEVEKVEIAKSEEKPVYKVYETPDRVFEATAGLTEKLYILAGIDGFIEDLANRVETRVTLKTIAQSAGYGISRFKEFVKRLVEDEKFANGLKQVAESLGGQYKNTFETFYQEIKKLRELKRLYEKGDLRQALAKLITRGFRNIYDHEYIPIADFQAGSGKILNAFKKRGLNTLLFGTELRKAPEDRPRENRVLYGVDFNLAYSLIKGATAGRGNNPLKKEIFWLNPPYTNDREITRKSIDALPDGRVVFGLFSEKDLKLLRGNIEGYLVKIPRKATGYTEPENPEWFVFVAGVKNRNYTKSLKEIEARSLEEALSIMLSDEEFVSKVGKVLARTINEANAINKKGAVIEQIEQEWRSIKSLYDYKVKKIEKLSGISPEWILNGLSLKKRALAGEKIFPDYRILGSQKLLSIDEVVSNPALLKIYEELSPGLFKFVKDLAEEAGYTLPIAKEEKGYVSTLQLGLVKYKYLPKVFELSETLEVLKELLSKEEYEKLQKLAPLAEKVVVKARRTLNLNTGEALFGYTPILALVDRYGKDIGAIEVSLSDFYQKLEEKGFINLEERIILVDPDEEQAKRLLSNYIRHIEKSLEFFGLDDKELQKYANLYREVRLLGAKAKKVFDEEGLEALKEFLKEQYRAIGGKLSFPVEPFLRGLEGARDIRAVLQNLKAFVNKANVEIASLYYKSEVGQAVKEKIANNILKVADAETEIKTAIVQTLQAQGKEAEYISIQRALEELIREFEEKPFVFALLKTRDDVERFMGDPSIPAERKERFKSLPIYPNGSYEYVKEKLGSGELADAFFSAISAYISFEEKIRKATLKLLTQGIAKNEIKALLNAGRVQDALKRFEALFINELGIKPHQYFEALRVNVKKELGERGHILGWEMRAGKTLAMVLSGYFANLLSGTKEVFMFPRSANMADIILQMAEFTPQILPDLRGYKVSTTELPLESEYIGELLSDRIYPNLLSIPEFKKMLVGRGKTQEKLGYSYVRDIEDMIEGFRDAENVAKYERIFSNDRYLKHILALPGFDKATKLAIAGYIYRLTEEGLLKLDVKNFNGFVNKLAKLGRNVAKEGKRIEELGKKDFVFHLVPKSVLDAVAYRFGGKEKPYNLRGIELKVGNEVEFKPVSETRLGVEGYYVPRMPIGGLESLIPDDPSHYFWDEIKQGLANALEANYTEEKLGEIADGLGLEETDAESVASAILEELKDGAREKLELEKLDFLTLKSWKKKDDKDRTTRDIPLMRIRLKEGVLGELPEDVKNIFEELLNHYAFETTAYNWNRVGIPAEEFVAKLFISPLGGKSAKEEVKNLWSDILSVPRGYEGELTGRVELKALPVKVGKELFFYKPVSVSYKNEPIKGEEKTYDKISVTVKIRRGSQKSEIRVSVDGAPQIEETPQSFAKGYYIHSKAFEGRNYVSIVDEADEAINPSSQKYKAFYALGRNADLKIAATGTPTSGDVKTPVALLGLVSDFSLDAIRNSMQTIEENFATFKIATKSELVKAFVSIVASQPNENVVRGLVNSIYDILGEDFDPQTFEQIILHLKEANRVGEEDRKRVLDPSVEYILDKLLANNDAYEFLNFAKFFNKFTNFLDKERYWNNAKVGLTEFLDRSNMKRTAPGTFDPIGLVSVLTGAGVSFQTREQLKRLINPNIKEELVFVDKDNLEKALKAPVELTKEVRPLGKLPTNPSVAGYVVNVPDEALSTRKQIKPAVTDDDMRLFNDVSVPIVARDNMLHFVKQVYGEIAKMVETQILKNPSWAVEKFDFNLSPKELSDAVSKSGVSVNDSFYDIAVAYLENNFEWEGLKVLETKDAEKKKLLELKKEVAEVLIPYIANLTASLFNSPQSGTELLWEEGFEELPPGFEETLMQIAEALDKKEVAFEFFNGKLVANGVELTFSREVEFKNPDWDEITKEPFSYRFKYRLVGGDNEELIDVYTNAGYRNIYAELATEGKSFLVAPSRVPTTAISILDTLAYLYKYKPADKEYQVLIRLTDKEIEKAVKALDTEKLRKRGIIVKTFDNHALLDLEVKKFAKRVKNGELGMVVIAPAKTIARGVDLSMMDTIVVPGTVQGSGKDFTQLLARTFNNTDRHKSYVYLFGTPLRINYYKVGKNEFADPSASYTSLVQGKLLKKHEFIYSMMSGKLVNVLENENPCVIPLVEGKEQEVERERNFEIPDFIPD